MNKELTKLINNYKGYIDKKTLNKINKLFNNKICFYTYLCKMERIIDGDTYILIIDLGFNTFNIQTIRAAFINTHEIHGKKSKDPKEKELGEKAKVFVKEWFKKYNDKCILMTLRDRKGNYGRYLGLILSPDFKECLNFELLKNNLAEVYKK